MFWLWDFIFIYLFIYLFLVPGTLKVGPGVMTFKWPLCNQHRWYNRTPAPVSPLYQQKTSTSSRISSAASAAAAAAPHWLLLRENYHLPPHLAPYDRLKGEFPSLSTSRFVLHTCLQLTKRIRCLSGSDSFVFFGRGGRTLCSVAPSRSWSSAMCLHRLFLRPGAQHQHACKKVGFQRKTLRQPRDLCALCETHAFCIRAAETSPAPCVVFLSPCFIIWYRSGLRFLLKLIRPPVVAPKTALPERSNRLLTHLKLKLSNRFYWCFLFYLKADASDLTVFRKTCEHAVDWLVSLLHWQLNSI